MPPPPVAERRAPSATSKPADGQPGIAAPRSPEGLVNFRETGFCHPRRRQSSAAVRWHRHPDVLPIYTRITLPRSRRSLEQRLLEQLAPLATSSEDLVDFFPPSISKAAIDVRPTVRTTMRLIHPIQLTPGHRGRFGLFFFAAVFAVQTLLGPSVAADSIPRSARGIWTTSTCDDDKGATFLANSAAIIWFSAPNADSGTRAYIGPAEWVAGSIVLPEVLPEYGGAILPPVESLTRCQTMPNRLQTPFREALAVFEAFDHVSGECASSSVKRCAAAVIDVIDVSEDDRFSRAEISRMVRAAALFVGYEAIVSIDDEPFVLVEYLSVISSLGPIFRPVVTEMIDSYDFDGDGFLSADELMQDRSIESLEIVSTDLASGIPSAILSAMAGPMASLFGSVLTTSLGSTLSPMLELVLSTLTESILSILADGFLDML